MSSERRPSARGEPAPPERDDLTRPSEATGGHTRSSSPGTPGSHTPGPASEPTGGHTRTPAPEPPARHAQASSPEPDSGEGGFWSAYWERFRRQQVDDPVEDRREGLWDRFKRQDVDDPVRGGPR
jgi:hypothetical protein